MLFNANRHKIREKTVHLLIPKNKLGFKTKLAKRARAFMNVFAVLAYISEVINKGLVDIELFEDLITFPFIRFWERYGGLIAEFREHFNDPTIAQDVESVYQRIVQKRSQHLATITT